MSIIAINNLFILAALAATVIGLIGGTITVKNHGSNCYEFYEALSYAGAIALIIFLAIRGGIFLITGG